MFFLSRLDRNSRLSTRFHHYFSNRTSPHPPRSLRARPSSVLCLAIRFHLPFPKFQVNTYHLASISFSYSSRLPLLHLLFLLK
jgi:hypothetical protein